VRVMSAAAAADAPPSLRSASRASWRSLELGGRFTLQVPRVDRASQFQCRRRVIGGTRVYEGRFLAGTADHKAGEHDRREEPGKSRALFAREFLRGSGTTILVRCNVVRFGDRGTRAVDHQLRLRLRS